MYLHLLVIPLLGVAMLWSLRLMHGSRSLASDNLLLLITSIAGWVLIFLGLALVCSPPLLVLGLVIGAMVVARYRDSERRALLWTLSVAADQGIPVSEATRAFAAGRVDEMGRRAARLADLLESGVSLPDALRASRNRLPRDADLAVRLGLRSDALADTLRAAAREDHADAISHQYYGGLLYFLIVVNLIVMTLAFISLRIAPTFEQILTDFDLELPRLTQWVFSASDAMGRLGLLLMPLYLVLGLLLICALLGYMGAPLPTLPWLDRWLGSRDTPVILQALSGCLAQRRPLPDSVQLLADSYPTPRVAKRLGRAAGQMRAGKAWCQSLVDQRLIRPAEAAVLQAAERIGNLPWALQELAAAARARLDYRVAAVYRLLSPLAVVVLAIPIALTALAVLLPMLKLIENLAL